MSNSIIIAASILVFLAPLWLLGRKGYAEIKRLRVLRRRLIEPETHGDQGGVPRPWGPTGWPD